MRDALGKIIYADYEEDGEPCASEEYICDNCGRSFVVEPIVLYRAKKQAEELDFGEETVSLL